MDEIVVGVDGSEVGSLALRWAAAEAELHGAELVAVLAWTYLDQHHAAAGAAFDPRYAQQDAEQALADIVSGALGGEGASRVTERAVCDLAAAALLDASKDADLLVVGARGLGGFAGLLLGSVSRQVAHHARCPVVVVPAGTEPGGAPRRRLVVGVDGSTTATPALRWAVREAHARGAELEVVHAWNPPDVGVLPISAAGVRPDVFEEAGRQRLGQALDEVAALDPGVTVHGSLVGGGAGTSLVQHAGNADLVVVGARGAGGFAGLLLGSVSHHVAHHAPCPVVIVPLPS